MDGDKTRKEKGNGKRREATYARRVVRFSKVMGKSAEGRRGAGGWKSWLFYAIGPFPFSSAY